MKITISSILIVFALISCSINGSLVNGLTSDYNKLSPEEKSKVVNLVNFDNIDNRNIYKINGVQLKNELQKYPKSLVYIFTNGCTSKFCLPMSNYENFAKENNYKLFLVMNAYNRMNDTTKQRSEVFTAPLFAIDNDFYNSNIRNNYTRFFENDLREIGRNEKPKWDGGLFFFENGKLVSVNNELPN